MGTQTTELILLNKNREKRAMSSSNFSIQMQIPGSGLLADGTHTVGRIEGNICITRVTLVVRDGFDGTAPTASLTDNQGNDWFTGEVISAPIVVESDLTVNAPIRPNPVYAPTVTTFDMNITGANDSSKGLLHFIVDYTQLDTVCGKYTH